MVLLMRVCIQRLEIRTILEALFAKEEIVAILAHPAVFQYLPLTVEALIALVYLHLRLEDDLQLV